LVLDNLNTHTPAALYEAFAPSEARRLLERLEIHYTPKHGSWLNMAEIELSVLARQCLDRRIPDQQTLAEEVGAWEAERNAYESSIDWRSAHRRRGSSSSISIPRSWSHQMTQTLRDGTLGYVVSDSIDASQAETRGSLPGHLHQMLVPQLEQRILSVGHLRKESKAIRRRSIPLRIAREAMSETKELTC
jgi:DDE superfamily endonuclease